MGIVIGTRKHSLRCEQLFPIEPGISVFLMRSVGGNRDTIQIDHINIEIVAMFHMERFSCFLKESDF